MQSYPILVVSRTLKAALHESSRKQLAYYRLQPCEAGFGVHRRRLNGEPAHAPATEASPPAHGSTQTAFERQRCNKSGLRLSPRSGITCRVSPCPPWAQHVHQIVRHHHNLQPPPHTSSVGCILCQLVACS